MGFALGFWGRLLGLRLGFLVWDSGLQGKFKIWVKYLGQMA